MDYQMLGGLMVRMAADTANFQANMDQIKNTVQSRMGDIEKYIGYAKTALVGFIGIASVNAFVGMIRGAIDAGEAMHDMAAKAGISVEALSALASAGKTTDTSAEAIVGALNKMSKNLSSVDEDGKGAAQALRALGVDFNTFRQMSPDQQMLTLAKAMDGFADGGGKSAAAMAILGKQGAELIPYLKDLAEVGELQGKMTSEQAAQADRFNDNLVKIKGSSEAWKKQLAMGMVPALSEASQAFLDVMNGAGGLKDQIIKLSKDGTIAEWTRTAITGLTYLLDAVIYVKRAFEGMGELIGATAAVSINSLSGLGTAAKQALTGDFSGAVNTMRNTLAGTGAILDAYGKKFADTFSEQTLGQKLRARLDELKGVNVALKEQKPALDYVGAAITKNTEEMTKAIKAGQDFVDALVQKLAVSEKEEELGRKLTESERLQIDLEEKLRSGKIALGVVQKAMAEDMIRINALRDKDLEWMRSSAAENDKARQAIDQQREAIDKQVKSQEEANAKIGLTGKALADYEASLDDATAAELRMRAEMVAMTDPSAAQALREQANQMERLAGLKRDAFSKQAAADAAASWKDTFKSISEGLYDALLQGGKSAWDYIKNMIKDTVLRATVMPVIQQGVGAVGQMVGGFIGGDTGSAMASGAGQWMNTASSLGSLYSSGSAFGGMFASNAAYGAAIGTTNVAAGSQAAMLAAQTGEFGAAGAVATSEAAAGAGAGAASWMSTLGPYAIIALALYAIFSDHSKWSMGSVAEGMFGADGKFGGTQYQLPYTFGNNTEHERDSKALRSITDQIGASLGQTITGFGGNAAGLGLSISTDTDREGQAAAIISLLRDGNVIGGTQTGSGAFGGSSPSVAASKMDAAQLSQWFATALPTVIVEALKASDIDARFKDWFNSVAEADLTAEKAQQMLATAQAVKSLTDALGPLGGVFTQFSGLTVQATADLANAAGGFDALGQKVSSYYSNFYSETERTKISWDSITKTLHDAGIDTVPKTRDQFRALVDGLNLNSEAGQKAFVALMNVSGSFAQLTQAADAAAKSMQDAIGKALSAAQSAKAGGAATPTAENLIKGFNLVSQQQGAAADARHVNDLYAKYTADKVFSLMSAKDQQFWRDYARLGNGYLEGKGSKKITDQEAANAILGPTLSAYQNYFVGRDLAQEQRDEALMQQAAQIESSMREQRLAQSGGMYDDSARQEQLNATLQLIQSLNQLKDSLTSFRTGLDFSSLSTLGAADQYSAARAHLTSLAGQAMAGDSAAMQQVQGAAQQFLTLSKGYYGSTAGFAADSDFAKQLLDALIARMDKFVDLASANLNVSAAGAKGTTAALNQSNSLLRQLATGSVEDAQKYVE